MKTAIQNGAEFVSVALLRQCGPLRRIRRSLRPRDEEKQSAAYCEGVYAKFEALCEGGRVLELGPGGNLGVAALFAPKAQSVFALDIVDARVVAAAAPHMPLRSEEVAVGYMLGDAHCLPIADVSLDFIYSNAVLEHLYDPALAARELSRCLSPRGVTAHQIDMRDHRHFDNPLRFLRYGSRAWKLMDKSLDQRQNRWRLSQYVRGFESAGFEVEVRDVCAASAAEQAELIHAAPEFRRLSVEDRSALSCLLVATKRTGT